MAITVHKVKTNLIWWTTWEMIPGLPLSAVGFPGKVSNVAQKSCSTLLQHWPPNPPCCLTLPAYFLLAFFRSTMSYLIIPPGERIELS